ncbi:hypothetical protein ANANG_G00220900 [Anguilla anguilla]|uniref:RRM domain-containing protein n=1 Tax=Anguilla anguilla TaxID=7936 RepID=A0A9D3RPJ2_ANGAN|nr:hypothetical protein ANANG_G00220900 [Anguilla anguilla]
MGALNGVSAKKKNKKGKTLTLTDFLAEDSGGNAPPSYPSAKPTSWADETDDLEGDVSTSWHTEDDMYRAPPIDTAQSCRPRAASRQGAQQDSIKDFFRGLSISAVRLPREPSNPERLKGFGYAEFDDVDSLLRALSLNEENLGNRRIRVDIADQSNEKERDDRSMSGRDRNRGDGGPDKTDSDWRARPAGRPTTARGGTTPSGSGLGIATSFDSRRRRRPFGSGFRRDYDDRRDEYRGSGDRFGDRYGEREDRYEKREERREERGPLQRPKLNLKPRSVPKEDEQGGPPSSQTGRAASIFGGAKPVDTAAKEREVEERLKKEQEKLQRQLDDDKGRGPERKPRERHPSWRNEDQPAERSRTGSESSQPGSTSGRGSRRRESERSVENEVFSGREDDPPSPGTRAPPPRQEALPLKRRQPPEAQQLKLSGGKGLSEGHRKDGRRERDSRPATEPKKYEESPSPTFSSASKYAALLMDGDQGDEAEENVE